MKPNTKYLFKRIPFVIFAFVVAFVLISLLASTIDVSYAQNSSEVTGENDQGSRYPLPAGTIGYDLKYCWSCVGTLFSPSCDLIYLWGYCHGVNLGGKFVETIKLSGDLKQVKFGSRYYWVKR